MKLKSDFISIDGKTYNVGIINLERTFEKLYKYAERTEDGKLHSEAIGTYYNYKISFGNNLGSPSDYDDLYETLSDPNKEFAVKMPYGRKGSKTFKAYASSGKDKLFQRFEEENCWNSFSVNFIATDPERT